MTTKKPSRRNQANPVTEFREQRAALVAAHEVAGNKYAEESLRHNRDLLFALSLASQPVQQARTPQEIYRAVGREIKALNCDLVIFTPGDDRKHLSATYTTFAAGLLRAAEKLTGIQTQGYLLPIQPGSVFARVIEGGSAEFLHQTGTDAALVLPKALRPLAQQLVALLNVEKGIVAPLRADGAILGVLAITGSKLEEGDVPAVGAFAAQVAISLKNVQLTQQLQKELDERKQAEKALRDSELRFRSLIEHGLDNISLLAADGFLLWESPAVVPTLGYEYDQFKGRNIFELMHPDDMEQAQLRFREIVSKPGNVIHSAFRLKHSNGSWRWMQGTGTNLLHVPSINAVVINYRDITESKQAEDLLQENARSLARAQRIGKLGDWDWDVEGNSLTWSGELYRIWGVGKDFPLTFDGIAGMIHPDDREMNLKAVQEFFASRDEGEFEFRIICPDGTEKWIHQNTEVTRAPSGQPIRMFGIMQDITEPRRAEEALRESEERLRLANKATNDVIWDWDIVNDSQRWNEAGTIVFGWSDIVESPQPATWWVERVHPEDRERVENSFFVVTTDPARNYWHDEYRFRKMDGSYAQVIDRGYVLRNAQGEAVRMIGAMLDITERRQAEEKLRESEKEFHSLAEAMPQIVWITKPDGWNIYFNQQWVDYTGQTLEESYGDGWNKPFHPDDQQRAWDAWQNATKNSAVYSLECRLRRVDGVYTWWLIRGVPLMDAHGNILKWFGTCTDIHEIKQAEEKILQLNATLENRVEERTRELREAQEKLVRNEKLAVLGQLAGGVGHELRNPLAVINNALYYLKQAGANDNEKVKEYLGIIQAEAHTAEKIITDLLDFARIKSVDVEPVSASELTARVLERYPVSKTVRVRLEIPGDLPMFYADPRQMEQVLGNLVINACQAMCSAVSPVDGELVVKAHEEHGMIAIAVKDNGMGIPPENLEKIFEPLFTTKAKGIGLGLAVSRKLAEANGGRIEVQSEAGKGSTFTVFLPIKVEAQPS